MMKYRFELYSHGEPPVEVDLDDQTTEIDFCTRDGRVVVYRRDSDGVFRCILEREATPAELEQMKARERDACRANWRNN